MCLCQYKTFLVFKTFIFKIKSILSSLVCFVCPCNLVNQQQLILILFLNNNSTHTHKHTHSLSLSLCFSFFILYVSSLAVLLNCLSVSIYEVTLSVCLCVCCISSHTSACLITQWPAFMAMTLNQGCKDRKRDRERKKGGGG